MPRTSGDDPTQLILATLNLMVIDDLADCAKTPILGLCFERNLVRALDGCPGSFTTKLLSSPGPLVSDFVTHEASFTYGTYGIHVGQDDRLTFMGSSSRRIRGQFVDCRRGSPTLHSQVELSFTPSLTRRLVIPRGIAHTFDGLERVVTRDEPVWHASDNNTDWNIDNDLISIDRDTPLEAFPVVQVNEHRLPDSLHVFQSRLSQRLLESPTTYLSRYQVSDGDHARYVMYDVPDWGRDEESQLRLALDLPVVPGVEFRRARYALTGASSWTIVPSTDSCVADVLYLPASSTRTPPRLLHLRTRMWYTFLNCEGTRLDLTFRDCRPDAEGAERRVEINCDPRITVVIDPGIAYSCHCTEDVLVRAEQEIFVDEREPREDLPIFGEDCRLLASGERAMLPTLPRTPCPGSLVRLLALQEIEHVHGLLPKTLSSVPL